MRQAFHTDCYEVLHFRINQVNPKYSGNCMRPYHGEWPLCYFCSHIKNAFRYSAAHE